MRNVGPPEASRRSLHENPLVSQSMRPGYGTRHPAMTRLLSEHQPSATATAVWGDGTLPLRVSAYLGPAELPDDLVTSVRCITRVKDFIVLCESADSSWSAWPGGRRNPGETFEDTACREVHEETGWRLDRRSIECVGWLHVEHQLTPPADYPYPYPDFLQLVMTSNAMTFDASRGESWRVVAGHRWLGSAVSSGERPGRLGAGARL